MPDEKARAMAEFRRRRYEMAKCPRCHQVVRVRKDGALAKHRLPRQRWDRRPLPECPGSLKAPGPADLLA